MPISRCPLCFTSFRKLESKKRRLITLPCRHMFCLRCIQYHCKYSVELDWREPNCPIMDPWCGQEITSKRCMTKKLLTIMRKKKGMKTGEKNCPKKNCSGFTQTQNGVISCDQCEGVICRNCEEVKDRRLRHRCKADEKKTIVQKNNHPQCPQCKSHYEHAGGCDLMTCEVCNHSFDHILARDAIMLPSPN